jgi:nucleoside-diphosphate-sugar epimerase
MKIAVIGGSGFIGTNLVRLLVEDGHEVFIYDKSKSKCFPSLTYIGDVRDVESLKCALHGTEVVYNLAAEHRDDVRPISLYYDVNVQGAKNTIIAAEHNDIKRIIFTSSVAVYGLSNQNPDETSIAEPFNHYGKSKLQAENVFTAWVDAGGGRSLTIIRPVVVFGEGNRGNVYNLIHQIQSCRFVMVGLGANKKSMAYVGNVVAFMRMTLEFGPGSYLYNFATKPDLTVRELVELIRAELNISSKMPVLPYALGLAGGFFFDFLSRISGKKFSISSIRIRKFCANTTVSTVSLEVLGFESPYTLHEGLHRMISNLDQDIYFEGGG